MKKHAVVAVISLLFVSACLALPCAPRVTAAPLAAASEDEVWVQQTSGVSASLSTVAAASSETACAVGNAGVVVFTRDEGVNWTRQTQKTDQNIHDVCCTDSNHFWYVGDGGTVFYTDNGAASWKDGWCNMDNDLYGISMATNRKGWISGKYSFWHPFSSMWNTTDGVNFGDQGWWNYRYVFSVHSWDDKHAIAVGSSTFSKPYAWTTTDGTNWGDGVEIGSELIYAVCAVPNTKKAFAVGNNGKAYKCSNYGTSGYDWTELTTGVAQNLWDVEVVDENVVWAVGDGGTIIKTTDGGWTWTKQSAPTTQNLHGIVAIDQHHAWAVGSGGTVLYARPQPAIMKCEPGEATQGQSELLNITGSNTQFIQGKSRAVIQGGGVDVISTSVVGLTEANVQIKVADDAAPGPRDVNIVTDGETPTPLAGGLTIKAKPPVPPRLDSISPPKGPPLTYVTLSGQHFGDPQGSSTVVFNNGSVATDYTQWKDDKITCAVPTSAISGNVIVHTDRGDSNGVYFEVTEPEVPKIVDTDPNSIKQGEAKEITITGEHTHFGDGSAAVFTPGDGIKVDYTTATDSNTAKAGITVDRNAPIGPRDVNVVTPGEVPQALVGGLTVHQHESTPPELYGISPNSGAVGDEVTLTGLNFESSRGNSYVSFNGAIANTYPVWGDNTIKCMVPNGAQTGMVTVTTAEGTSGGELFTVGVPMISNCSPKSVVQGHSVEVDILGKYTHFANGTSRAVFSGDGIQVTSTGVSDATHATATIQVAATASPGFRDVNVVTGGETPQALMNVFRVYQAPPGPPVLRDITPASGRVGAKVVLLGRNFGAVQGNSQVVFNGKPARHYVSWTDEKIECSVPFGASTGFVQVSTPWGISGGLMFEVKSFTFFFAEGTCRPNFDSYITIQNPDDEDARVRITYMLGDGNTREQEITITAHTRQTVDVNGLLGEGNDPAHDFSAKVECTNGQEIIAERPMYFDYQGNGSHNWTGGHDAVGALDPARTLYVAEGSCRPDFEPYLTIQNPGAADARLTITYMLGDGTTREQPLTVQAHSRSTVSVFDFLGTADSAANDFSARVECTNGQDIVVERPVYFNYKRKWNGGSDAVGVPTPATAFQLAEGTCRPDFDPYICVQNPGQAYARVKVTYFTGTGDVVEQLLDVAPNSRYTVAVKDVLGSGNEPAYDFSATILSLDGQEILVERPMYFNYQGMWNGGHDVVGAFAPATTFYFAEGSCRPDFRPYLTILNPELAHAQVKITYMLGDGTTKEQGLSVPANSRSTVPVYDFLGLADDAAHDFSARIECTNGQYIVVERPMYFNYQGVWDDGSDAMGFHAD